MAIFIIAPKITYTYMGLWVKGKYTYMGLWVKYALGKRSYASKNLTNGVKKTEKTVSVFLSTLQLTA